MAYRCVSSQFWKGLTGLGGMNGYRLSGLRSHQEQPYQHVFNSVGTAAARLKDVNIENTGAEL